MRSLMGSGVSGGGGGAGRAGSAEPFGVFARMVERGPRSSCLLILGELACRRSGDGKRADPGERREVVTLPGPAGGEVKRPGSAVAGEAPGDREQSAAQRACGANRCVGQADQLCPSE